MSVYLLDVAVGPIYLIIGFFLIVIVIAIIAIIYFAVKAIRKIKREVEEKE